jgi:alpha-3'-ketoglucosidase
MKELMLCVCSLGVMAAGGTYSKDAWSQGVAGQNSAKEIAGAAKPQDTEQWEPIPPKVSPGASDGAAPSDAIVLFDGRNLDQWVMTNDRSPARWRVENGTLVVDKAYGNIETKRLFKNYQLHLEYRIPADITGEGQARGNSGLFLASTGPNDQGYEIQILDSFDNATYVNGQAASVYKQNPPLVNASRKPGEWQSYDVIWAAPVFHADGTLETPAAVTVLHNGVLVQNHFRLLGETVYVGKPAYRKHDRAAIELQSHHDPSAPISFRNIWVRELP